MFTNVTLIVDFVRVPDVKRSGKLPNCRFLGVGLLILHIGSGLTRIQRSLLIITIGLFCYIALGALVNSFLLNLTFVNGLYFTVVTIETIGFGDIVPHSASSRIFVVSYGSLGLICVAFVVGYVRETVLEGLEFGCRSRLLAIQERRRAARLRRRIEKRWRHAIICRLRERHELVWIHKNPNDRRTLWSIVKACFWRAKWGIWLTSRKNTHQNRGQHGAHLNLWALPLCQLEAAALEAGAPLDTLLPEDFYDACGQDAKHLAFPSWFAVHPICHRNASAAEPPTRYRLGAVVAIVTKLTLAVYGHCGNLPSNGLSIRDAPAAGGPQPPTDCFRGLQVRKTGTCEDKENYREDLEDPEKKAYYVCSCLSWLWLLIFWVVSKYESERIIVESAMLYRVVQPPSRRPRVGPMDWPYTFVSIFTPLEESSFTSCDRLYCFHRARLRGYSAHYTSRSFHLCRMGFGRRTDYHDLGFRFASVSILA